VTGTEQKFKSPSFLSFVVKKFEGAAEKGPGQPIKKNCRCPTGTALHITFGREFYSKAGPRMKLFSGICPFILRYRVMVQFE